jgi:C-terminal processing protease CtpA/Prc
VDSGICDPYVPGTIIFKPGDKPILVLETWPHGPAEKEGICSGDQIAAVNGISTTDQPRIVKEIFSSSPSPVRLEVRRGAQIIQFDVPRARESTLAMLSEQKFARVGGLIGFFGPVVEFPLSERPAEIQAFQKFLDRMFARDGFKRLDGVYVPAATNPSQFDQVEEARQSDQVNALVGFSPPQSYSGGFRALLLKNEVLVETVIPDSPAYHAGVLPGDQIVSISGRDTSGLSAKEINQLLSMNAEPKELTSELVRGQSRITVTMALRRTEEIESSMPIRFIPSAAPPLPDSYILGIAVFRPERSGEAVVAHVQYPSPAFKAGIHLGDVLLAVNGLPLDRIDASDLSRLLTPSSAQKIVLGISRLNKKMSITLTPVTYRAALASIGRKPTKFGTAPESCPDT